MSSWGFPVAVSALFQHLPAYVSHVTGHYLASFARPEHVLDDFPGQLLLEHQLVRFERGPIGIRQHPSRARAMRPPASKPRAIPRVRNPASVIAKASWPELLNSA